MSQIHKKFNTDMVVGMLKKYLNEEIDREYIQELLEIKRSRFFSVLKKYKENPERFSIEYKKNQPKRINPEIEEHIFEELSLDKSIINNKDVPIRNYNYSYIKKRIENKFNQTVSLPTIIDRAKKNGFYIKNKKKKKVHDREVLTNYPGELIQHDSSYHLWAPDAKKKWHLITSLDDYSRLILFGKFVQKETTFKHIKALETVVLKYGIPFSYYVDSHSIFRFVRGRDSYINKHHKLTDDVDPQWKIVLNECNIKLIYALSPQAKGKIERPYRWLQDNIVRTCVRENIDNIKDAQDILNNEINLYNYKQVHSTTKEIPSSRFDYATNSGKTLFRDFHIPKPLESVKDLFSVKITRMANAYRRISINNISFRIKTVNPRDEVTLRIYPLDYNISEIRFWVKNKLVDVQKIQNSEFKGVHF